MAENLVSLSPHSGEATGEAEQQSMCPERDSNNVPQHSKTFCSVNFMCLLPDVDLLVPWTVSWTSHGTDFPDFLTPYGWMPDSSLTNSPSSYFLMHPSSETMRVTSNFIKEWLETDRILNKWAAETMLEGMCLANAIYFRNKITHIHDK